MFECLVAFFILLIPPPCEAENVPMGSLIRCWTHKDTRCCTWRYVADRYCTRNADDDCSPSERANDSMNALRVEEKWCIRVDQSKGSCGWLLKKESYYYNWDSNDYLSKVNRKVRKLLKRKKYRRAKWYARYSLKQLVKRKLCKKNEPCDDHLEFIAYASIKELKQAMKEWGS